MPLRSFTSATLRTVVAVHEFMLPGITVLVVVPAEEAFAKISRNAGIVVTAPVLYVSCTPEMVRPEAGETFAVTVTASVFVGAAGFLAMPLTVVCEPTVIVKLVLVTNVPSVTLSVIVETPVCPLAGVTVTVRLVSVPPMTTFALGTKVVLDEVLLTDRMVVFNSASPIVKGSAAVAVLRATD